MATQPTQPQPNQLIPILSPDHAPKRGRIVIGDHLYTLRELKLVNGILSGLDRQTAGIQAGYDKNAIHVTVSKVLKKAKIQALLSQQLAKSGISAQYVLDSLKGIADHTDTRNSDRIRCLELLGKHLQMFKEVSQIDHDINVTIERIG